MMHDPERGDVVLIDSIKIYKALSLPELSDAMGGFQQFVEWGLRDRFFQLAISPGKLVESRDDLPKLINLDT